MTSAPTYRDFLGDWELIPETCIYEQGVAPVSGRYRIEERDGALVFHMAWKDAEGEKHEYSFSGIPDGVPRDFNGGELADSLSVTAVSKLELSSSAFYAGRELMLATRSLIDDGLYLDIRQIVRLPDGTEPCNFSRYKRVLN